MEGQAVLHSLAALKMYLEGTTSITPSSIVQWPPFPEIHFRESTQGTLSKAVNVIVLSRFNVPVLLLGVSLLISEAFSTSIFGQSLWKSAIVFEQNISNIELLKSNKS